jgi:hypothetical protein
MRLINDAVLHGTVMGRSSSQSAGGVNHGAHGLGNVVLACIAAAIPTVRITSRIGIDQNLVSIESLPWKSDRLSTRYA